MNVREFISWPSKPWDKMSSPNKLFWISISDETMKLQPPKIIQQSPFDALPRPFDEKIMLFLPPSPNSCRILGHLHPKRPPKIIYPSLHSIESICQGFILWGATGWWRPKINFSMLTVVFLIVFFSCSFQGLVIIGLLWLVFFLFFLDGNLFGGVRRGSHPTK